MLLFYFADPVTEEEHHKLRQQFASACARRMMKSRKASAHAAVQIPVRVTKQAKSIASEVDVVLGISTLNRGGGINV